jgi:hypothetical protein
MASFRPIASQEARQSSRSAWATDLVGGFQAWRAAGLPIVAVDEGHRARYGPRRTNTMATPAFAVALVDHARDLRPSWYLDHPRLVEVARRWW